MISLKQLLNRILNRLNNTKDWVTSINGDGSRTWNSGIVEKDWIVDCYSWTPTGGTTGTLTKWNSGKCELEFSDWGATFNAGTQWFSGCFVHEQTNWMILPTEASNWKLMSVTPNSGQIQFCGGALFNDSGMKMYLCNGTSATISGVNVHLAVKLQGSWK